MTNNSTEPHRPRRLAVGDTIGVVAPSSPFDREWFRRGIDVLHQMGFGTKVDERAYAGSGYLAGGDHARADQLNAMFGDDDVQAVMCAGGGYGALRILDLVDYGLAAANPKPLIGFSDITALHQALYLRSGLVTFHGPTVTTLRKSDEPTRQSWLRVLTRCEMDAVSIPDGAFLVKGRAEGVLVGGNLTVLSHLIGTPFWVPLKDKILFIEDTNESPYRIDRMAFQMKMAGLLEDLKGLVLGNFHNCGDLGQIFGMFSDLLGPLDIPVASGLPFGHGECNLTLPLGVPVCLDSGTGMLSFTEPVLEE